MPEFNLGKIVGPTGPQGPKGEQGEQGLQGATGPKGDRGIDGSTPIFTVGSVETLDAGSNALVEVDCNSPENPVISFYIPKGADGKDGSGDMEAAIYDTEGRKTDVYEYARSLHGQCLRESGGFLSGELVSAGGDLTRLCVRNICISNSLPEDARKGDICFLTGERKGTALSALPAGCTVGITENGKKVPYIIAGKNYHGEGSVTLIRKNICTQIRFSPGEIYEYEVSLPDAYLENNYIKLFHSSVQKLLMPVEIAEGHLRKLFIPSKTEIDEMTYFAENGAAATNDKGEKRSYWTRSRYGSTQRMYSVDTSGGFNSYTVNYSQGVRPMLVLDATVCVENVNAPDYVYEIEEITQGIFVRSENDWERVKLIDD